MQGHRRRRVTRKRVPRDRPQPHQPEGWRRDGINFFVAPPPRCHYIASSSLRELDAVALATKVMVFMG